MEEENKEVENVVVENEVSSTETPAAEVNPVETPKSADDTNGNPLNVKRVWLVKARKIFCQKRQT